MLKLLFSIFCLFGIIFNCNAYTKNYDVRTKSDVTAEELDAVFQGELVGTGKYFIEAQEKYNINAVFLAAIAIHESGNGKSKAAKNKKNFFGLMRKTGGQMKFESAKECIDYAANNLTKENGYYYARGRYTIHKIGQRYASDKKWTAYVVKTMKTIKENT